MKVEGAAVLGQGQAGGADREEPGGTLCGCLSLGDADLAEQFVLGIPIGEALPSQGVEGVAALVDVVTAPVVELPWPAFVCLNNVYLVGISLTDAGGEHSCEILEFR